MAPIHTAAKQGDLEGVKRALADGADVDGKDSVRAAARAVPSAVAARGLAKRALPRVVPRR